VAKLNEAPNIIKQAEHDSEARNEEKPMADVFTQLKQKYQPVLDTIQSEGAQLQNVNMDGNQLYVKATAKSEESKNKIWDAIKKVDPNYADLKHDIQVDQGQANVAQTGGKPSGSAQQGGQKYTVKPGDNLSKISQQFYGDAKKYMTIAKANNLEDPDKIKAGQELIIPAA
jgi:LysM repeat protein